MKKLFLIGGMGAGKSTARKALTDEGLAWIDLDQVCTRCSCGIR